MSFQAPSQQAYLSGGATAYIESTVRTMTPYYVYKNELNHISLLNTAAIVLASVGSFFLSVAVTLWLDSLIEEPSTTEGTVLIAIGPWVALILAAVFYLLTALAWLGRRSEWKEIQKSTRVIQPREPDTEGSEKPGA